MTICDPALESYIEICNEALRLNRHRFPFKQILTAAQDRQKTRVIEVRVLDEGEQGVYALFLENGHLHVRPHGDCQNCVCDGQWSVAKSYIEDVVKNPQIYIENPARIDWEWMYDVKR